jgi:hypothetical protein
MSKANQQAVIKQINRNLAAATEALGRRAMRGDEKALGFLLEQAGNDPAVRELTNLAEAFEVPLWVMFVPNLPSGLLSKEGTNRLVQHVEELFAKERAS